MLAGAVAPLAGDAAAGACIAHEANEHPIAAAAVAIAGAAALHEMHEQRAMFTQPPADAYDPEGAKAPGKPSEADGLRAPKGGDEWERNPNGRGHGWRDRSGNVWVPTGPGGEAHGGPHWDVQTPGGGYVNVYPGGVRRP
ncbi:MAG: hypothetical protein HKL99_10455 [Burkholderiales bacterium]|nr:hypothetical protein [Burkholderiales bacterium]